MSSRIYQLDRRWLALAALAIAQFMVFLDETVVNVALPSIKVSLGFSQATLAWVVSAYIVVFGGLVLLAGGSPTSSAVAACSWSEQRCSASRRCSTGSPSPRQHCSAPACFRVSARRSPHPRRSRS
jgi:hypothetical protein